MVRRIMRMWRGEEVGRLWVRCPGVNALRTVVDLGIGLVAVEGWRVLAHGGCWVRGRSLARGCAFITHRTIGEQVKINLWLCPLRSPNQSHQNVRDRSPRSR